MQYYSFYFNFENVFLNYFSPLLQRKCKDREKDGKYYAKVHFKISGNCLIVKCKCI